MSSPATNHRRAEEIRRTVKGPRPLPANGFVGPMTEPPNVDTSLANGLRVITVRRPATPMVEVRLWIPFAGWKTRHPARSELLAATITKGMADGDGTATEDTLASVGGSLTADVTPERLLLSGRVLTHGLPVLLETMASLLTSPAYAGDEVLEHRRRLAEHIRMMDIDATVVARRALQKRRFGEHPIAYEMAGAAEVASVTPRELRELHMAAVVPRGATVVLVGDIDVDKAVDEVTSALNGWASPTLAQPLTALPVITAAPLLLVPKIDAVQSQIRMSAQAVGRTNPRYPAVVLANLVFGGYFASRLGTNLAQQGIGRTSNVHSYVELNAYTGSVVIEVDSAADATADVLNETRYELARLICHPPDELEVAAAREYALGAMHFGWATQAGLASQLAALAGVGLGMPWLLAFHPRLRDTTRLEITHASQEFLAPVNWTGVVVACPELFPALSRFCAVTQQPGDGEFASR